MPLKLKKQDTPKQGKSTQGSEGGFPSWMKTGTAAQTALEHEREVADQRQAEQSKMWRYWMKAGDEAIIVFLDGDLLEDGPEKGKLAVGTFYEHTIKHKGNWLNIICIDDSTGDCPLCEADDKPSLVAAFTVIDTRKIQGKNKVYENEPKVLVAKQRTITQLQKMATKRGGLRGCVFDVSRSDDRAARVGDQFDFETKLSEEELIDNFGAEHVAPANYAEELTLRTKVEIHALLQGTLEEGSSVGSEGVGTGSSGQSTDPGDDVPF